MDGHEAKDRARILHLVTDLRSGGTQRLLLERVRRLDGFRHGVLVFHRVTGRHAGRGAPTTDLVSEFAAAGVPVTSLLTPTTTAACLSWMTGRMRRRLHAVTQAHRPTLIHSTLYHTHLLGDRLAASLRVPHLTSKEGTDDWMGPLSRRLESRALGRASRVIAVSEATRRAALSLGVDQGRIRVIPNGIDPSSPGGWSVPESSFAGPRLIGVGRLDAVKGWQDLLRAMALLRGRWPDLRLDLIGMGEYEGALRRLATRLDLTGAVHLHPGGLPASSDALDAEPPPEGANRPIFVAPSREEGFGLVLLEAMARGLPVVATSAGGIPEVVRPDREGLLVPPADPEALAVAVARLLIDPELARRLSRAGMERARAFDLGETIRRYGELYAEVTEGAP